MNGDTSAVENGQQNGASTQYLTKAYLESIAVRTVYGPVPLKFALHWPVSASYDDLSGCATWMGGRIPTAAEARSIYNHVDVLRLKEAEQHLGKTVPAVNGYDLVVIHNSNAHQITDGIANVDIS